MVKWVYTMTMLVYEGQGKNPIAINPKLVTTILQYGDMTKIFFMDGVEDFAIVNKSFNDVLDDFKLV